ncbi:MAG: oligosaccharide flippase family protein [Candidatus Eisenbacteria bacterium]|nr:oligosaccharide flippase family protein [Candidatus Eisenbacteria bacterium]
MSRNADVEHQSSPQQGYGRVGGALSWSVLGKAVRGLLLMVTSVMVARGLGTVASGHYSATRNVIGLFTVLCWMGLTQALLRYLPEMRVKGNVRAARRLVLATLGLQSVVWAGLFAGTIVFRPQVEALWHHPVDGLVILATGLLLVDLFVTTWTQVLTSWYEIRNLTAAQALGSVVYLVLALLALRQGHGAAGVLVAAGISSGVTGLVLLLDSRRFLALPSPGSEDVEMGRVVRYALPFAAIGVLNLITWRSFETLILGHYWPGAQVGFFDKAYNVPQQFMDFVPAAIWPLMLASFSEVYARDPAALSRAVRAYYKLLFFLAAPISVWGATVGARAVPAVYGPDWAPAGPLCAAFFAIFAVTYLATPLSLCLYVMEKTWVNLLVNLGSAAVILGLNFALVPRYGMWGAAVPVALVIALSPFVYHSIVRRWAPQVGIPWSFILRCYAASAPLAALGLGTQRVRSLAGLVVLSAAAGVLSIACIRWFRLLGEEERALFEKLRLPMRGLWVKLLFRGAAA